LLGFYCNREALTFGTQKCTPVTMNALNICIQITSWSVRLPQPIQENFWQILSQIPVRWDLYGWFLVRGSVHLAILVVLPYIPVCWNIIW